MNDSKVFGPWSSDDSLRLSLEELQGDVGKAESSRILRDVSIRRNYLDRKLLLSLLHTFSNIVQVFGRATVDWHPGSQAAKPTFHSDPTADRRTLEEVLLVQVGLL